MPPSTKPFLVSYLRAVASDALFVLASSARIDRDKLIETATRRNVLYGTLVQGATGDHADWHTWLVNMCVALAPVSPPLWLPMRDLVDALTLETGARGVRSLFTSKPSDKQVARTRSVGTMAVRGLTAVMAVDGELTDEDQLMRRCVVAALGMPETESQVLVNEERVAVEELEIPAELEPKVTKRVARGLWVTALRDGLDPREDEAVMTLCKRLGLSAEDTEASRREVSTALEAMKAGGAAAVDAVRFVLSDDDAEAGRLARATAYLALPPTYRQESLAAIEHAGPLVLARRHALERPQRELCLALAWFAALATDPTQTRRAELAVRHDRVASDLGSSSEAASTRATAEGFVQDQLAVAVQAAGL